MKFSPCSGASARANLHNKMLTNLFQCPIELFEAYPIGRILNRLSCDMFVIGESHFIIITDLLLIIIDRPEAPLLSPEAPPSLHHLPLSHRRQLYSGGDDNDDDDDDDNDDANE